MLGKPLMEWQQHVADVILEIDPDTGRLVYNEWTLLTPRQSGKSTLILAKSTHRALATKFFGERQSIVYTAQTRIKATEKFRRDFLEGNLLKSAKLKAQVTPSYNNNSPGLRWSNGSWFSVEANTEKSGHGDTLDEAYIDEAFSQIDNRLEQAFEPAMVTRVLRQLGVISTAGWLDASPYLWEKVEIGRRLVADDVRQGTAYFEWSAPDNADPSDEWVWLAAMPALHRPDCGPDCTRHTVELATIRSVWEKAQRSGKIADFCRAYLNMWRPKPRETEETALGNWSSCEAHPRDVDPLAPAAIGIAVEFERTWASIASAAVLDNEKTLLGAVDRREGVEWVVAEAKRIQDKHGCAVVLDEKGPGQDLPDKLRKAGVEVTVGKLDDYVVACSAVYDAVKVAGLVHVNHPELNDAVKNVRWRPVGDRRVFGRKTSEGDISMLEAATWAAWAAGLTPEPEPTSYYADHGVDTI